MRIAKYQSQDTHGVEISHSQYKHGGSYTSLHKAWRHIKNQCFNKNARSYDKYGGRGFSIPRKWLEYIEFRKWAYANGYVRGYALRRKDKAKGYYPSNLEWLTRSEAARRNNIGRRQFTPEDIKFIRSGTKTQADLHRLYKVDRVTICNIVNFKTYNEEKYSNGKM